MKKHTADPLSLIIRLMVKGSVFITAFILVFIILYIIVKGFPYLTPDLFAFTYTSDNVSVFPAIMTTVMMVVISLAISVPLSIACAIYLVEYAKRKNRVVKYIRLTTETLAGIPSIVYGLFGLLFFVTTLQWGFSILAGAFTLSIMILPLVIRSTEEALKSVPDAYREASFGLGAGKLRTLFKICLPAAVPGILAGVILAIGRIVGESAALIYTAGTVAQIPGDLFASGCTLAIHMYALSSEGLHIDQAYATAIVLLATVFVINIFASFLAKKVAKG